MRHHFPLNTPPPMLYCEHVNQELDSNHGLLGKGYGHRSDANTWEDAPAHFVPMQCPASATSSACTGLQQLCCPFGQALSAMLCPYQMLGYAVNQPKQ